MRWQIERELESPKDGEIRVIKKFAWVPLRAMQASTDKPYRIWLEMYQVTQRYMYEYDEGWGWRFRERWVLT